MKFMVNNITDKTVKANLVSLSFTNEVENIPADFKFDLYMPKSVELIAGQINEIPYWIAKNIWTSSWGFVVKAFENYSYRNAPRGMKKKAKDAASKILSEASKFNPEPEPEVFEEVGNFVGNIQDNIFDEFKVIECCGTKSYTSNAWTHSDGYWRHPYVTKAMWKFEDRSGNCFMASVSNDVLNETFENLSGSNIFFKMKAKITDHTIFRGLKQTWLFIRSQKIETIE